jgi:hypothetical protein
VWSSPSSQPMSIPGVGRRRMRSLVGPCRRLQDIAITSVQADGGRGARACASQMCRLTRSPQGSPYDWDLGHSVKDLFHEGDKNMKLPISFRLLLCRLRSPSPDSRFASGPILIGGLMQTIVAILQAISIWIEPRFCGSQVRK